MGQDLLQQGEGAGLPPTGNDNPPEGQGQGANPPEATGNFGENWKDFIPEDLRGRAEWDRISKPEDIFTNYIHQTQTISKSVRIPDASSTPEQINEFYQKLGKPADKAEYDFSYTGQENYIFNKDSFDFDVFRDAAEAANLSKTQYEALAQKYLDVQNQNYINYVSTLESDAAAEVQKAEAELRSKWGQKYDINIQAISNKMNSTYSEETLNRMAEAGLFRDAAFLEHQLLLTKMQSGDTLYIDGNVVTDVPQTIESLTAKRDELMAKDYAGNRAQVNELNKQIVQLKMAQHGQAQRAVL